MNAPPAFQFYPDDFIGGTVDLSAEDVGAYIRLLCYQWGRGEIPENKSAVDRVAGCTVSREVLAKFPNRVNERLETVRAKLLAYHQTCSEAGKAGADKRWGRHSHPTQTLMGSGMGSDTLSSLLSQSPSPSPNPSKFKASKPLTKEGKELAAMGEQILNGQWPNDGGKWVNRIRDNPEKVRRVFAEVENAVKESRVSSTPAQYAEDTWKHFA